jgi:hypothetical protein
MGFSIGGAFNKSVFDKSAYRDAIGDGTSYNGYSVIRIQPKYSRIGETQVDPSIIGVIKEGVNYNIKANWSEYGGIASTAYPTTTLAVRGAFEKVNATTSQLGFANIGAAYSSRKIYQKSGYLIITPSFRVVDWKGEGQTILAAALLAYYCVPKQSENLENLAQALDRNKEKLLPKIQNDKLKSAAEDLIEGGVNVVEGVNKVYKNQLSNLKNNLKKLDANAKARAEEQIDDLEDAISLRSSPVPIKVRIGKFFTHTDMIIENVDFSFSKEMTQSGPLFLDVNLSLSSRKIITSMDDIGIAPVNSFGERFVNVTGL